MNQRLRQVAHSRYEQELSEHDRLLHRLQIGITSTALTAGAAYLGLDPKFGGHALHLYVPICGLGMALSALAFGSFALSAIPAKYDRIALRDSMDYQRKLESDPSNTPFQISMEMQQYLDDCLIHFTEANQAVNNRRNLWFGLGIKLTVGSGLAIALIATLNSLVWLGWL